MEWRSNGEIHYSNTPVLHYSIVLDFHLGEYPQWVFLKNLKLIFAAQEFETIDDRNQIIRRFAGLRTNRAAGAGGFSSEKHLIDAALFDSSGHEIHVIGAAVIVQIAP